MRYKSNLRAIQLEFLTKMYRAARRSGLDTRNYMCWLPPRNRVLARKINRIRPPVLSSYRHHRLSRCIWWRKSSRLQMNTTRDRKWLLGELVGLELMKLPQITVAAELVLWLAVPVQPQYMVTYELFQPRRDNLPSGYQRYPLLEINLGYINWGQKHSSE